MSWAEDMGIDCGDETCVDRDADYYWHNLRQSGYIWSDRNDKCYTEGEIDNDYLLKILNFCKRNYRPKEQVQALKELAVKRGLVGDR